MCHYSHDKTFYLPSPFAPAFALFSCLIPLYTTIYSFIHI